MSRLIKQVFRFGIIGVLCFIIDYMLMIILTEIAGIEYLLSSGISFTISVIVNYLLSMRFVFQSKQSANKITEFLIFVFLSIVGLGINEALMWYTVEKMGIYYMVAKIIATAVVMVYNFVSRKIILEDNRSDLENM